MHLLGLSLPLGMELPLTLPGAVSLSPAAGAPQGVQKESPKPFGGKNNVLRWKPQ